MLLIAKRGNLWWGLILTTNPECCNVVTKLNNRFKDNYLTLGLTSKPNEYLIENYMYSISKKELLSLKKKYKKAVKDLKI